MANGGDGLQRMMKEGFSKRKVEFQTERK